MVTNITRILGISMSQLAKPQILRQIAAIPAMERGKLSAYSPPEGSGVTGPYHKLQAWENGKNHTRHVPAEQRPAVAAALAGYAQFQDLTTQYAELVITETRQSLADAKKKPRRRPVFSPKSRKSNT